MAESNLSQTARIVEHKKFRNQSRVRIKSGVRLVWYLVALGALVTWFWPNLWPLTAGLVAFFAAITLVEFWAMRKHYRALEKLRD